MIPSPDSWQSHAKATIRLGLPLIGAQLAQTALNVTNPLVLGRVGPDELAASVLGWHLFFVVWIFGSGFGFAVVPLVANALGAGRAEGVQRYVRAGLWIGIAYALLMMVPLWQAERIYLALGQDPELAALAASYLRVLQWSLLPQLAIVTLRSFIGALQRPIVVVIALVAGVAVNAALNLVLVHGRLGLPALGVAGSGLATVIATSCVAIGLLLYCSLQRAFRPYRILGQFLRPDRASFSELLRLGTPIGLTVVAEVALFSASSFLMGWVGPLDLAAHGIALQLSGLAFMIPLGLSAAATIRVGWMHGRQDRRGVMRAAATALIIGIAIALVSALVFLTLPQTLVGFYLDLDNSAAAAVLPIAASFLAVAAAFQLVDSLQVLACGALRGLKDARVPMLIALVSYWLIGLPVAWGLAFPAGLGGIGIWWGLAIGLATAAALMMARLVIQVKRVGHDGQAAETAPGPGAGL